MESREYYCSYCKVSFVQESDFKSHCSTESHQFAITTDQDRKWNFRSPPRGISRNQLSLCAQISTKGTCRLGDQCLFAHCEAELLEWNKRIAYREWKMDQARQEDLNGSAYAEQLLERWLKASLPDQIMTDQLEGFDVSVTPKLFVTFAAKNSSHMWTWSIKSKIPIRIVSLLYDTHRKYFQVTSFIEHKGEGTLDKLWSQGTVCQEFQNQHYTLQSLSQQDEVHSYTIKVQFKTDIFGTFRQTLVLDFGKDPVIIQKMCVDVVPPTDLAQLQEVRETVLCATERWNSFNRLCVLYKNGESTHSEHDIRLLKLYPVPHQDNFVMTQVVSTSIPVESTYQARFHELLYIEEIVQYNFISRYNVSSKLHIIDRYILTCGTASVVKYAHGGELFACMKLSSDVSEDSPAGRMIQAHCNSVYFASILPTKDKSEKPKVYEAIIEDKGKKMIYLRLSSLCVAEMKLEIEKEYSTEVQFQVNRMSFCEMHYAVDNLSAVSLLFPDVTIPIQIPKTVLRPVDISLDNYLNPKQKDAILAIAAPRTLQLPPVLIIGPFGTGKTFTLAQAVKQILLDSDTRVLVCTHSNSAADIYIRDYLHPYVESGHQEAKPLRIYYQHRWVATVNQTVLKYCLISEDNARVSFKVPTALDVQAVRVVVTTLSSSRYLVNLGLKKGFFTHILIDEAAQAMECEAIMPLALADMNTRIALAGDHMQLSPDVYSHFTQEKNLQLSLLERLFDLYPTDYPCKILLCENYRSHKAIVRYTSDMFYENGLLASKDQPVHKDFFPLTFFTARGEDIQDVNSTAYYNNSEVYEVAERVVEIHKTWPTSWGPFNDSSIGVVTPYYDQVVRIRTELRKRKLPNVSVERVLNVQGKQFRAIILSTVRTLQTCRIEKNAGDDLDFGFLSNARLLNTAITRGQSLVAVVGDPISLCSMGKCRKLWEKFIRICNESGSLYGITWQSLQTHLDGLELKKTYMLNPLAPEFFPKKIRMGMFSTPDNRISGNVLYHGSNLIPPYYHPPMVHDPSVPFYSIGRSFFDPIPYPHMGVQFPPHVPFLYTHPSYGYPWFFASNSTVGSNENAGFHSRLEPINPKAFEPDNSQAFKRSERIHVPVNNLIYNDSLSHSRMNEYVPEKQSFIRRRLEPFDKKLSSRVDRNQNSESSNSLSSNMFNYVTGRNSSENFVNRVPCTVQPYSLISGINKQHVSLTKSQKSNYLEQLKNEDRFRAVTLENNNFKGNRMAKNKQLQLNNSNVFTNNADNFHTNKSAQYAVDDLNKFFQQSCSLSNNHFPTTTQKGSSTLPENGWTEFPRQGKINENLKRSVNNFFENTGNVSATRYSDTRLVTGIKSISRYQAVNEQDCNLNPRNKKRTPDEESDTLKKLLQVSQRVWSEPLSSSFSSNSSSMCKTTLENTFFQPPFPQSSPCLISHEANLGAQPETRWLQNSIPQNGSLDCLGTVPYNRYTPSSGPSGNLCEGYDVFRHKTILTDKLKNQHYLHENIFL